MVSQQVSEYILSKIEINSEELRELLRLCPRCRRLQTSEQLGAAIAYKKK